MAVPVLVLDGVVVLSLVEALDDRALLELRGATAERIGECRARGLVIDVSALDVMDSYATRTLVDMAKVARLRGARAVVVGIQPDVAFAMVQLGLTLDGVQTALDLQDGMAIARANHMHGERDGG